jgi:hypothetical protein
MRDDACWLPRWEPAWRATCTVVQTAGVARSPGPLPLLTFKQSFEVPPVKRLPHALLLLLLAIGLVACGPPKKSVFPPNVTIQQLVVLPDNQWQLTLRIQNNSYGEMDFKSLDGQLQLAALLPIRVHATFERDIPALAGDVLQLIVLPTPEMQKALQALASQGSGGSLAYDLSGSAQARPEQEKLPRRFDFSGNDWLSPVPGVARTYR